MHKNVFFAADRRYAAGHRSAVVLQTVGMMAFALVFGLVLTGCPKETDTPEPTAAEKAAALATALGGEGKATANGTTVTLTDDVEVATSTTITVPAGVTLATDENTLTVAGAVTVASSGTLEVRTGSLTGSNGTITVDSGGKYITGKTGPELFGGGTGSVVLRSGAIAGSNEAITEHGTAIGSDWLGTTAPTENWRYDPRIALTTGNSKVTINKDGFKIEGAATITRLTVKAETMTIVGTVTLQSNYPEQHFGIKVDDADAKIILLDGGSLKCTEDGVIIKYVADSGNAFANDTFEGLKADGTYGATGNLEVTTSHDTLTWTANAWVPSP
jgi:hypothetical protein